MKLGADLTEIAQGMDDRKAATPKLPRNIDEEN